MIHIACLFGRCCWKLSCREHFQQRRRTRDPYHVRSDEVNSHEIGLNRSKWAGTSSLNAQQQGYAPEMATILLNLGKAWRRSASSAKIYRTQNVPFFSPLITSISNLVIVLHRLHLCATIECLHKDPYIIFVEISALLHTYESVWYIKIESITIRIIEKVGRYRMRGICNSSYCRGSSVSGSKLASIHMCVLLHIGLWLQTFLSRFADKWHISFWPVYHSHISNT